eukprot:CAMPEP_0117541434 /NCGR_PEP_ID=MMETSP0784-20121206/44018_1 /TAXON_ID=39447 /ORGANISM="" /LENGTH=69 /DNA_ID=CAMNT_0005338131 /DNA_START=38 /DNA_END=244 /DNA_ORIENTATION=+
MARKAGLLFALVGAGLLAVALRSSAVVFAGPQLRGAAAAASVAVVGLSSPAADAMTSYQTVPLSAEGVE